MPFQQKSFVQMQVFSFDWQPDRLWQASPLQTSDGHP
jgi:hypothetical protein